MLERISKCFTALVFTLVRGSAAVAVPLMVSIPSPSGSQPAMLNIARYAHTLLPNGKVLVVGANNGTPLDSAELYDQSRDVGVTGR